MKIKTLFYVLTPALLLSTAYQNNLQAMSPNGTNFFNNMIRQQEESVARLKDMLLGGNLTAKQRKSIQESIKSNQQSIQGLQALSAAPQTAAPQTAAPQAAAPQTAMLKKDRDRVEYLNNLINIEEESIEKDTKLLERAGLKPRQKKANEESIEGSKRQIERLKTEIATINAKYN